MNRSIAFMGGLSLAFVIGTTGCQKSDKTSDPKNQEIKANSTMEPEPLALAGEQLMSPYTFMLADKVFDMALAKDPQNYRSRFYKAVLKPLMVFQGINKRLRPYVTAKGNIRQFDKIAAELPASPALDFLVDGREDIGDVAGMQSLVDQYITAFNELYQFLKTNEETPLTINLNVNVWEQQIQKDQLDDCSVITNTDRETRVVCNYRAILQRKLALPDMIALRHQVAGAMLYAMVYNSYSLEGVDDLIHQDQENPGRRAESQAERLARVDSLPRFGLLRPSHKFAMLRTFGADLSAAWKYMIAHQNELCPAPSPAWSQKRRKGYLFSSGFCDHGVRSEDEKMIALLDQAMRGPVSILAGTGDGRKASVMLDAFRFADQPVANLKSIFPSQFNSCGEATALRDPTFGGVLPNGEGNLFLSQKCPR